MQIRRWTSAIVASTALLLAGLSSPANAVAQTFTVVNTNDAGAGSFRQAVLDANANAGVDTIEFAIASEPNDVVQTIALTTGVIVITEAVTIDGYTQANATPNTLTNGDNAKILVEIRGPFNGTTDGIQISAGSGGVTIKGLAIDLFNGTGSAIVLSGTQSNIIAGNFIGPGPTENIVSGNGRGIKVVSSLNNTIGGSTPSDRNLISLNAVGIDLQGSSSGNAMKGNFIGVDSTGAGAGGIRGIWIQDQSDNNTVGGTTAGDRNVISANSIVNVRIEGDNNTVRGNYIGTNAAGTAPLSTTTVGIAVADGFSEGATTNTIGGTAVGAGNVISGNSTGITVQADAFPLNNTVTGTAIQGNLIGTDPTGSLPVGNAVHGIYVDHPTSADLETSIGGTAAGVKNVIAFNGSDGVSLPGGTGTEIRQNSIFDNGDLGIDLNNDTVTPNDALDPDSGPNDLQNFPVITSAETYNGDTYIAGTINSTANTELDVDLFSSPSADASGNGEGKTFIGSTTILTNGSGDEQFNVVFPVSTVGEVITATATEQATSGTSEFSTAVAVVEVAAPANDNKGDALKVVGNGFAQAGTTKAATTEPGEQLAVDEEHTVWFKWKAPRSRQYTANICSSAMDGLVTVFKKRSDGTLKSLASVLSASCNNALFTAKKDTNYWFQVGDVGPDREAGFILGVDKA
jgi:hypothetical protein